MADRLDTITDKALFIKNLRQTQTLVMQNYNAFKLKVWDPLHIFRCSPDFNYAIMILDRPIKLGYDTVLPLWEKAKVTVTVDGGTNRWINYLGEEKTEILLQGKCKNYLPTLVTGDMDSINLQLLKRLEKTKAKIINTPDQNHTDFTKALIELQTYASTNNVHLDGVYVLAETSGRFDHIIANVNTLYKVENLLNSIAEVIIVASNSLTWPLKPGKHKILIPDALIASKSWSALMPFGSSSSRVSTTGLKWNLDNKTCMKFGDMVSTSNTYSGDPEVTVTTNETIIWSMGIEPFTSNSENSCA